ncbi:MAG: AMP-binding protein [Rhodospirillales bacterium]|nr:AMP-binding protein [Rhodospirillales bacterium]
MTAGRPLPPKPAVEPETLQTLVAALSARGGQPAIVSVVGGATTALSYAELGEHALRLAAGLRADGLKPGEPVVLFGPNSADWIIVRLALGAAGAVAVAFDDLSSDAEIAVLTPDSKARRIFAAAAHVPRLRALAAGASLDIRRLDDARADAPHWSALIAANNDALSPISSPPISPLAAAMLVYTSGTTGTPKSFYLTHANLMANVRALRGENIVAAGDRALLPLPLHHVYPLTVGCLTALALGATIVLPEAVTGPQIVAALKAGRASVMVGVPRLYAALLSGIEGRVAARGAFAARLFAALLDLSVMVRRRFGVRIGRTLFARLHREFAPELRLLASGGAKLEAAIIWRLEGIGWEVLSGYGLAETASILTCNRRGRARIGSEGRPLPGAELRVADPDAAGVGEIEARGRQVFAGYRRQPVGDPDPFAPDGWFRTGDLGFIDADGFVHIVGRAKEMIVLGGGKNVFPEELEKVYGQSPYVKEIAVLEQAGALVALVVPDLEAIPASRSVRIDDVLRVGLSELSRRLPSFQRIAGYAIAREPIPRTRLGKPQRFRLGEIYARTKAGATAATAAPLSAADRAMLDASPAREIWAWLGKRYKGKSLFLDMSPQLDLGIDSLEWVTMTLELAERFDVHFSEEDLGEIGSLRELLVRAGVRRTRPAAAAAAIGALTPEQETWLEPPGPGYRSLGLALYGIDVALMRLVFRLRVDGRENLPTAGPYIVVANHLSDLDPLALASAMGLRRLQNLWWSGDGGRLFDRRAGRALARAAHIFRADDRAPAATLAYADAVLAEGRALAWFPESWRSPDGALQRFLPGIGHILLRRPVPVVPVRITGTFEALPRHRRLPRPTPISIVFGPAIDPRTLGGGDATAQAIADALHDVIAALPGPGDKQP